MVIRGDKNAGRSFAAFYFQGPRLIAADCVNRPQEFMLSKRIIGENLSIKPEDIGDEEKSVKELLQLIA